MGPRPNQFIGNRLGLRDFDKDFRWKEWSERRGGEDVALLSKGIKDWKNPVGVYHCRLARSVDSQSLSPLLNYPILFLLCLE